MAIEAPPSRSHEELVERGRARKRAAIKPLLTLVGVGALAILLAAWVLTRGGSKESDAPGTEPTTASSAPATSDANQAGRTMTSIYEAQEAARKAVRDDYLEAVRAGDRAAERADPSDADLSRRLTGDALDLARRYLASLRATGVVIRGAERDELRVFEIKRLEPEPHVPTRAVIEACWVSWAEQYDAVDGRLLSDGKPGVDGSEEVLVLEDGVWKITERTERREPCAGVTP